jgi:predicted DNA-binding antitoxin AbrB/MazE fold protein
MEATLMTKELDAIYENGTFRPVGDAKIPLPDGTRVRLSVESVQLTSADVLALAARVYAGLSDKDVAEIEQIAMDRSHFFTP